MPGENEYLDRFLITLDWLLAMHARYPAQLEFGLLHICLHEQQRLGQAYGAPAAFQMLNDLAQTVRREFRKTDLVARDGADIWVLVPYTEPSTVTEKVTELVELASQNGLSIVDRDVAVFSLRESWVDEAVARRSGKQFLQHLKANRHVAVSLEHE